MSASTAIPVEQARAEAQGMTRDRILQVAVTAGQVLLLALVIREFELESRGLYRTLLFAVVGFVAQAMLPARWRMPCFAVVSVASVYLLFSTAGLWVLGIGVMFLVLSLAPVPFWMRVTLVVGAVVVLGAARVGILEAPVPGYVWPVAGGMFMFRLALFLYSIKHEGPPRDMWATLGYFFMIPNAAFPFFPIVDYKTFVRQHYDAPESALYARGLAWMTRGIVHLLLYRVVYHYLIVDPAQIRSLGDVVQYCLQTYLLYLRVSGQFHLIVGLLHLFGFRLPESHHLYYLSSSFTELWRRINIYWKDFMMKVVYHPTFFSLRKLGNDRAILLSTGVVMLLTWLLHGWQKFWIVGGNPFTAADSLFWAIIGVLVLMAAAGDLARARRRTAPRKGYDLRRGIGTVVVYLTISLLFTLWTSETPGAFFDILRLGRNVDARGVVLLSGVIGFFLVVGGWNWGATDIRELKLQPLSLGASLRQGALHGCLLGGLVLVVQTPVKESMGDTVSGVISHVASGRLNERDQELLTRGYYESLSSPNRLAGQLWEAQQQRPDDWVVIEQTPLWTWRSDYLASELTPSQEILFKRQMFRTNSHGLHDQEYSLVKPEGTYRIALLGASPVMAPGVPDGQSFEAVLEDHLNQLAQPLGRRIEILNFGVSAYSATQQMLQLEEKVLPFQPDLVLLTSMPPDRLSTVMHLQILLARGIPAPDTALQAILTREGLTGASKGPAIARALGAYVDTLLVRSIARSDSLTRSHGARAALLLLRLPANDGSPDRVMAREAAARGWEVFDLTDIYGAQLESDHMIADYDRHWNVRGHHLMARLLEQHLHQSAARLGLPPLWETR